GRPGSTLAGASLVSFFVIHYGMFWLVRGFFVCPLPLFVGEPWEAAAIAPGADPVAIVITVIGLFISHGLSYRLNFIGGGGYKRISPASQMFGPYGRLWGRH